MIPLLASIFTASLVGSLHCAGMCGGFVCFIGGGDGRRRGSHIAYHVGRLLTYATLGAAAGGLGAGIDRLGHGAGLTRAAALGTGALMVAWGGWSLAAALGLRRPGRAHPIGIPIAGLLRAFAGRPPILRALALGLLTTLLPCGWLWAFVATAGATADPLRGGLVMVAFWLGTVPALAGVAALARGALGPLARRLPALTAAALLVVGLLTMAGKLRVGTAAPAAAAATTATGSHGCH